MDDRIFRNVMGNFATGITVITTKVGNETSCGMTANTFVSVSLNPKLILVSIGNNAKMLGYIRQSNQFTVNFLSSEQKDVSMQFAGQLKETKPYEFEWLQSLPIIENSLATIVCNVYAEQVAGDHTLIIGEVTDFRQHQGEPLLFYQGQYRQIQTLENSSIS